MIDVKPVLGPVAGRATERQSPGSRAGIRGSGGGLAHGSGGLDRLLDWLGLRSA